MGVFEGIFQETFPVEDPVLGGEEDAVPGAVSKSKIKGDVGAESV